MLKVGPKFFCHDSKFKPGLVINFLIFVNMIVRSLYFKCEGVS